MKIDEYYKQGGDWNQLASDYNEDERIRFEKGSTIIRELTAEHPGPVIVLDAACGSGLLADYLDSDRFRLLGLEISEALVHEASKRFDRVELHDLDHRWPFADNSVDVVFAGAVLEHIFDYHSFLNETNRVLKDGGLVHIQVPNLGCWREVRRLLLRKQPHWLKDMQHIHGWTRWWLTEILEAHQFPVVDVECDRLVFPIWRNLRCRTLERLLAGWGSVLLVTGKKQRQATVVDRFLAVLHKKHKVLASRWVEVEAASANAHEESDPIHVPSQA